MKLGKKSRSQETSVRSLFRKKWNLPSDNAKSQHQTQNCDGFLESSLKIELGKFPIKGTGLRNKAQKAGLFKETILLDDTNKT